MTDLSSHVGGSLFGTLAFTIAVIVSRGLHDGFFEPTPFLALAVLFGASLYACIYSAVEAATE